MDQEVGRFPVPRAPSSFLQSELTLGVSASGGWGPVKGLGEAHPGRELMGPVGGKVGGAGLPGLPHPTPWLLTGQGAP